MPSNDPAEYHYCRWSEEEESYFPLRADKWGNIQRAIGNGSVCFLRAGEYHFLILNDVPLLSSVISWSPRMTIECSGVRSRLETRRETIKAEEAENLRCFSSFENVHVFGFSSVSKRFSIMQRLGHRLNQLHEFYIYSKNSTSTISWQQLAQALKKTKQTALIVYLPWLCVSVWIQVCLLMEVFIGPPVAKTWLVEKHNAKGSCSWASICSWTLDQHQFKISCSEVRLLTPIFF